MQALEVKQIIKHIMHNGKIGNTRYDDPQETNETNEFQGKKLGRTNPKKNNPLSNEILQSRIFNS